MVDVETMILEWRRGEIHETYSAARQLSAATSSIDTVKQTIK